MPALSIADGPRQWKDKIHLESVHGHNRHFTLSSFQVPSQAGMLIHWFVKRRMPPHWVDVDCL